MSRRSHRWRGPQAGRLQAGRPLSQQRPRPEPTLPSIVAPRIQPPDAAGSTRAETAEPLEHPIADQRAAEPGRVEPGLVVEPGRAAEPGRAESPAAVASRALASGEAEVDVRDSIRGEPRPMPTSPAPSAVASLPAPPRPGSEGAVQGSAGPSAHASPTTVGATAPPAPASDAGPERGVLTPASPSDAIPLPDPVDARNGCTAAQLRRFIKSRAYVPLHELRRRFELNGDEDDVSAIDLEGHRLFVGLPTREADLLAELLQAGDIGYELLLDPSSPLVIGVFPMRPVPRA